MGLLVKQQHADGKTRQTQLEIEAQGWCRPNYPQKEAIYLVFMSWRWHG